MYYLESRHPRPGYVEKVGDRLRKYTPIFLAIRKNFGLPESVGFGYLPLVHESYGSYGLMLAVQFYKDQIAEYDKIRRPTIFPDDRLIVRPKNTGDQPAVVSLYEPGNYFPDSRRWFLDGLNRSFFEGVVAHELVHYWRGWYGLPDEIKMFVEYWKNKENIPVENYDQLEAETDLIACICGYREQVLASRRYMLEMPGVGEWAGFVRYAISQIKRYT